MVSFAEPASLWLLLVPAAAAVLVLRRSGLRRRQQRRLASPKVWDRLMGGVPATGALRMLLWSASAVLVVLALARPQWGESPAEQSVRTRDLVVAIDVSDSMLCPDVPPARLARALELVQRVLPRLEGNRVGVVVFAGEAYPLVPLTTDLHAVSTFLAGVEPGMIGLPGSNLQRAVAASLRLLPEEGEGRVVVLLTDGENLQGSMDAATETVRSSGVGVLAIVAGTEGGGPIPVMGDDGKLTYKRDQSGQPVVTRARADVLGELARAMDGEVLEIADRDIVELVVDAVERLRTREVELTRQVELVDRFPLFLVCAALLLTAGFAVSPWRRVAAAVVLVGITLTGAVQAQQPPPEPPAEAPDGEQAGEEVAVRLPWWQRLIPGGSRRLARSGVAHWQEGELEEAGNDFASAAVLDPCNPDRLYDLGTVLVAGGALEQAIPVMEQAAELGSGDAAYNAGTGALLAQDAEVAVRWLRRALMAAPDDPEVKRNYELALRLLEQQQQQEQQQEQDEEQDEEQDQEEQQQEQQQGDQPTPTPTPSPAEGAAPTPTPDPNSAVWAALEQAEAEARDDMRSPTPQAAQVEKDW